MTTRTTATDGSPSATAHDAHASVRGVSALRHPVVSGGLIGIVGGAAFVFGGVAGLPEPAQAPLRWAAAGVVALALVAVLFCRRALPAPRPPAAGAGRVYGVCVVAMLLLMPFTRLAALALDAPTAQISLVAAVVGAHFLPFARAFHAPVFRWIGGPCSPLGSAGHSLRSSACPPPVRPGPPRQERRCS